MKQITSFDKKNLAELSKAINKALGPVAKEFGLGELRLGGGRFENTEFTAKLIARPEKQFIATDPSIKQRNNLYIKIFGLPENVMDMVFTSQNKTFSIVGFNPKRSKNSISLETSDGKTLMCPAETIQNLIKLKKFKLKA